MDFASLPTAAEVDLFGGLFLYSGHCNLLQFMIV
nr:MAG TPA: hypothetical protein [Caudoviricetes sp.]